MAHKKGKSEKRAEELERLAMSEARRSLVLAIEWIDQEDYSWAIVQIKRALTMLKAARNA